VLLFGSNKGFIVTKYITKRVKPSHRRGKLGKRVERVRQIIREITGLSPFERRAVEYLKAGGDKDGKKALRLCRKRLGTMRRGKKRIEYLENYIKDKRAAKPAKEKTGK